MRPILPLSHKLLILHIALGMASLEYEPGEGRKCSNRWPIWSIQFHWISGGNWYIFQESPLRMIDRMVVITWTDSWHVLYYLNVYPCFRWEDLWFCTQYFALYFSKVMCVFVPWRRPFEFKKWKDHGRVIRPIGCVWIDSIQMSLTKRECHESRTEISHVDFLTFSPSATCLFIIFLFLYIHCFILAVIDLECGLIVVLRSDCF